MPRRGRNSRRRGNFRNPRLVTSNRMRVAMEGTVPRGRFDPPRIVVQPWNQVVLASWTLINTAGFATYTVASLTTGIQEQLGLNANPIQLRFRRVNVWTTPGDVLSNTVLNFALQANALLAPESENRWHQPIEDFGTVSRPAHAHFLWSNAEQQRVFSSAQDGTFPVFRIDTPVSCAYIIHVHVYWRMTQTDPVPSTTAGSSYSASYVTYGRSLMPTYVTRTVNSVDYPIVSTSVRAPSVAHSSVQTEDLSESFDQLDLN